MLSADKHMLPIERIAVLTDLGEDLDKTLDYAATLCRWYNSELLLFHATDEKSVAQAREKLNTTLEKHAWCDIPYRVIISKLDMSEALSELDTYTPDILILTTRAKEKLRKWTAGSTTQQVFRQTHHPVLVLGPEVTSSEKVAPSSYNRILYSTDMSAVSVMALHFAAGMAHDHQAQLTALYVEDDPEKGFTADRVISEQRLRDWMQDHIGGMGHAINHAQITVAFGSPAKHILETARNLQPDLIVMGAQGMGAAAGLASRFLGGTTYEVCCNSKCPLLIVPEAH